MDDIPRGQKTKKRIPVPFLPDLVCNCLHGDRTRTPTPPTLETIAESEEDSISVCSMVCASLLYINRKLNKYELHLI